MNIFSLGYKCTQRIVCIGWKREREREREEREGEREREREREREGEGERRVDWYDY